MSSEHIRHANSKPEYKVSVIVPVYNAGRFLERCLYSLVGQTYDNLEIVVIDDGSQDSSPLIIKHFAERYPRIRAFTQKNSGPATARNTGLQAATGEYIMFCDADDSYERQMCQKMLSAMIEEQVDMVMCNTRIYKANSSYVTGEAKAYLFPIKSGRYVAHHDWLKRINVYLWNKIFKKSIIEEYSVSFPDGRSAEDNAFIYQYMSVIKSAYMLYEPLYNHYEDVEGSVMTIFRSTKITIETLYDKIDILNFFYDFLIKNNIFEKNREYFLSILKVEIYYLFLNLGEAWEVPVFEKLDVLLRRINLYDLGDDCLTCFAEALKNGEYKKGAKYLECLVGRDCGKRRSYLGQKALSPAFEKNNVAIFFNCDNNYIRYIAVAIRSIIENSSDSFNYDIIILHEDIRDNNIDILQKMTEGLPNFSLRFFRMGYYLAEFDIASFSEHGHISIAAYYRLLAPLIFENYDRIVYLDCDLIMNTDAAELFCLSFEDKAVAAVVDYYLTQASLQNTDPQFCQITNEVLKINDLSTYFNSGVMVLNLEKIRREQYLTQFLEVGKINNCRYHDQDILNSVLQGDVRLIDAAWNFQTHPELDSLQSIKYYLPISRVKIIHFCSQIKPWHKTDILLAPLWWGYARKTPWYESLLKNLLNKNHPGPDDDVDSRSDAARINSLKISFWRYRLLSKITFGKTRERYAQKKSAFRSRVKEAQKLINH